MNLGDLQSARSKERQRDSLQHLSEDFYADVGVYVAELRTERERAAEAADDPFDAPEVRRLTDDIKTAENTVEAVYERRVGKLVKLASLAAAGMPADGEGLTAEESDLFETLVGAIESNRAHVLDDVLAGDRATHTTDAATAPPAETETPADGPEVNDEPPSETESVGAANTPDAVDSDDGTNEPRSQTEADGGVTAAEAMGTGTPGPPETAPPDGSERDDSDKSSSDEQPRADRAPAGAEDAGDQTPTPDTDRTTVRITRDVGEVFGADERTYHLAAEDVVTLPEVNATPLVERDAAERLN